MICVVNETVQVIQCGDGVTHQGHQEKWKLEDIFLDELKSVHNDIIPVHCLQRIEQRYRPKNESDPYGLEQQSVSHNICWTRGEPRKHKPGSPNLARRPTGSETRSLITRPIATALAACL